MSLLFLLEIGTEEIPDWMIIPALNNLQDMSQALLDQNALGGKVTGTDATPRRLVLRAEGLAERQADTEETVSGPPKSAGAGAAAGFAKKMGTTPDQLGMLSTAKGEYFSFAKRTQGQATSAVLARELPGLILKIQWPKTMVWNGKGTERFIRPVRWLVALLGDAVVPFEIGGVKSGNTTVGHRVLGKPSIPVTGQDFNHQLKSNGVILSATERRDKIETGVATLLAGKNLQVKSDPDLLNTLTYITEFPTPILGSFDSSYLSLPQEVLVEVMRHHQKYLSVEEHPNGKLASALHRGYEHRRRSRWPHPPGQRKGSARSIQRCAFLLGSGSEEAARGSRRGPSKTVTFQAKFGSYEEQGWTRGRAGVRPRRRPPPAQRAALLLAKCDLTTDMVKEFTDLQGIVGGLYARAQGEGEEVAQAVYDHYRPLSMEDKIPLTEAGRILSLGRQVGHAN